MKEPNKSWKAAVRALRLQFLQGNSHIPNIAEWIEERVVEALDEIRATPKSQKTKDIVANIEGRG